jgi:hypothetical protein
VLDLSRTDDDAFRACPWLAIEKAVDREEQRADQGEVDQRFVEESFQGVYQMGEV